MRGGGGGGIKYQKVEMPDYSAWFLQSFAQLVWL